MIYYQFILSRPILRINNKGDLKKLISISNWSKFEKTRYKKNIANWFFNYMDPINTLPYIIKILRFEILVFKNKRKLPFPFTLFGRNKYY